MKKTKKKLVSGRLSRNVNWWRASDEIYRDLFENATDIVFTTDLSGHFLDGNRAVERLLGYTVEEAKELTWEKLVAPYDMPKAKIILKRHAKGETHINYELDAITRDGAIRAFEIGSRPIFDEEKIVGFHGIARDITQRKRMQIELVEASKEATRANHAKSTFLANMSHEIRTPINGILGFLSLMAKTKLTAEQREYLKPMEESAKALIKIIDDILDLSKIEAGQLVIDDDVIDLGIVVDSTVELLRPFASEKSLSLSLHVDSGIPQRLHGDKIRIGQIISNLVNNAIKFTEEGEVAVTVALRSVVDSHAIVSFQVADTGIGFAPEEKERLFEPFQQLDNKTTRRYSGTGLGLTITRNLVRAMGGAIDISSSPGKYTTVQLDLPFRIAGQTSKNFHENKEPISFLGHGLRVLVVDDNEINRRFLSALLRRYRCTVQEVDSGRNAQSLCQQERFDIVLMDVHMAGMDGVETSKRIKDAGALNAGTPIIAVSADVMEENHSRFAGAGIQGFLAKPLTEELLFDEFRRWFPQRCSPREHDGADRQFVQRTDSECVLNSVEGVRLAGGDETLWRESLVALVEELPRLLGKVRVALEEQDYALAREIAHRIAGSAAYVAAADLRGAARELFSACGGGEGDEARKCLQNLEIESARFRDRAYSISDADALPRRRDKITPQT